ncbi:MAG: MBL fold metallo-hydrolase [Methanohalobium sp.]|uniref:MBL fold metallo-hydrolase n=1 Tax=Methanohalobium sp. TaxID=2837493 RepID=UPI00397843D9
MYSNNIKFRPVCFDSMGAKSTCTLVTTPDTSLIIDPGAAIMHKTYPISDSAKLNYLEQAKKSVMNAAKDVEHVVISHYHYDHLLVDDKSECIYKDKDIWIKDPNQWINFSQWDRSRKFLKWLGKIENKRIQYTRPLKTTFKDPIDELPILRSKYYDYNQDFNEAILSGQKRFLKMSNQWARTHWINLKTGAIHFADGKGFQKGDTKVRFSEPLFHGVEYSRTGWIISTIVESNGAKLFYSSDLQGPVIEDYAQWIINENPDILILDGPATYLLGYMLSNKDLERSIDNAVNIIENCNLDVMIYDHHLLRDPSYKEHTSRVWETAKERGISLLTAAEYNGDVPVLEKPGAHT